MLKQAVETGRLGAGRGFTAPEQKPARDALAKSFAAMGAPVDLAKNVAVYGAGKPAHDVRKLVSGAVRTFRDRAALRRLNA